MKKSEAKKKINELLKELKPHLKKECERLLNSGGIDVEKAENNYALPKIILHIALENQARQYRPFTKEYLKEAKNLRHY